MTERERELLLVAREMYEAALMFFWEVVGHTRDAAGDIDAPQPWEDDYRAPFVAASVVLDEYIGITVKS
jgi:hypothetical protein